MIVLEHHLLKPILSSKISVPLRKRVKFPQTWSQPIQQCERWAGVGKTQDGQAFTTGHDLMKMTLERLFKLEDRLRTSQLYVTKPYPCLAKYILSGQR